MIRNKKVKKMDKKTRRIYQKNKREIVIAIGIIASAGGNSNLHEKFMSGL